jgi:hypothetical protein
MKIQSIASLLSIAFVCNLSLVHAQTSCCGGQTISPPKACCAGVTFDTSMPGTTATTSIDLSAYANIAKTIEDGAAAFGNNFNFTPPGNLSIVYTATANSQCCSGAVQTVYVPSGSISLALGSVTGKVPIWPNIPYFSQGGLAASFSGAGAGTFKPCTPPDCSTQNTPAEADISVTVSGQVGVYWNALLNAVSATATAGPTATGMGQFCQGQKATWSGNITITGTATVMFLGFVQGPTLTITTQPWPFTS